MKGEISTFERRISILSTLINGKQVSRRELSRQFSVSDVAIGRDITALSKVVPIGSKMGRYGGIYLISSFKTTKAYLSREEEELLQTMLQHLTGKQYMLLKNILFKFAMPK